MNKGSWDAEVADLFEGEGKKRLVMRYRVDGEILATVLPFGSGYFIYGHDKAPPLPAKDLEVTVSYVEKEYGGRITN